MTTTAAGRIARVAAVAAAAVVVSCRSASPPPPGPIASAILATAAELGAAPTALVDAWTEIGRIAARVDARHRHSSAEAIDDLTAVVFDDLAFAREVDDDDPRFFLPPSVLGAHRGSCLGLGALYLLVAERIGLPLDGVRVPGHFFVRTRGPSPRNIELLRRGETMPDAWYRQKYGPWPEGAGDYFRPLSGGETSALFWFNAGNFARRLGELDRARRDYERAIVEAPDFAEAQASVGLARQLEGALPEAARAYGDAARTRADLPGLGRNMALLDHERNFAASPEGGMAATPGSSSPASPASPASPPSPRRSPQ